MHVGEFSLFYFYFHDFSLCVPFCFLENVKFLCDWLPKFSPPLSLIGHEQEYGRRTACPTGPWHPLTSLAGWRSCAPTLDMTRSRIWPGPSGPTSPLPAALVTIPRPPRSKNAYLSGLAMDGTLLKTFTCSDGRVWSVGLYPDHLEIFGQ